MKKKVKVVAAIIENKNNEILCDLKSLQTAIERKIKEELKCEVKALDVFNDNTHAYDTFIINLICIKCKLIGDTPTAYEHSPLLG